MFSNQGITKSLLLSLVLLTVTGSGAFAQSAPAQASISGVQVLGSGCDMSNTSVTLSPDFQDMSVLFDDYTVEIGNGSALGVVPGKQKDCQILVDVSIPMGWQFAFKAVDYRGFVALPASAWAFHRFSAMVPNSPVASMKEVTYAGPKNSDYTYHTEVKPGREVYSPCNMTQQRVTLLSQMAVNYYPRTTDRSNAMIALDSADLSLKQKLTMIWRKCGGAPVGPIGPRPPPVGPVRPGRF